MSKKKKKSKAKPHKAAPQPVTPKILEVLKMLGDAANKRQAPQSVVEPLITVQPPENFAEHLQRIGASNLPRIMDVMFGDTPTECIVIPWEELQAAEYNYYASGIWKGTGRGQAPKTPAPKTQAAQDDSVSQAEVMRSRAGVAGWHVPGASVFPDSDE